MNIREAEVQFRMKIFLLFTFFLISGLGVCFDVIGYKRGSVIIHCSFQQHKGHDEYFCKDSTNPCVYVKSDQNSWVHEGRVSLQHSPGVLRVFYRNLSLENAGSYQCGETGGWSHTVKLRVKTDPCCSRSKTVTGYLSEMVSISFSYPEEFQTNDKYLFKASGEAFFAVNTTDSPGVRFSMSDDRSSKVVSVRISDVREDDGGHYYCGLWIGGNPLQVPLSSSSL
ncbi:polymeric immunoglobulin receptor-like [Salminus brasiliensis]|uniref:polymeric immunoglobulin receptor-like n=1 Tax=Salminus brasiliensis TaxID=930266 RepID=UPI003B83321C